MNTFCEMSFAPIILALLLLLTKITIAIQENTETQQACVLPPVIVTGCGHSGTSLLANILGSHPDAHGILGETYFLLNDHSENSIKTFYSDCNKKNKKFWVEKTPAHVHHISKFLVMAPSGKVVLIYRNGIEVAMSHMSRGCKGKLCSEDDKLAAFKYGAIRWGKDNAEALKYLGNPRIHFVQYEALVWTPQLILHDLCAFLGIAYLPDVMLSFYKKNETFYDVDRVAEKSEKLHLMNRNHQMKLPLQDMTNEWRHDVDPKFESLFNSLTKDCNASLLGYSKSNTTMASDGEYQFCSTKDACRKKIAEESFAVGFTLDKAGDPDDPMRNGIYPKSLQDQYKEILDPVADKAFLVETHHRYYGMPWFQGREIMNFLLKHAHMATDHYFLDFGCGSMRAGVWIAGYLQKNRYFCIEPDKDSLRAAITYEVPLHGLTHKGLRFVSNDQFNLSGFSDVKFDRVLAHAVEIHLSEEQAGQALKSISNYLSFGAKLYFSHRTPWLYKRMGAAAFEKQFQLAQTNEFFFPCSMYSCKNKGTCFDDPRCKDFDGYYWTEFSKV